jgi:hypothetical protein
MASTYLSRRGDNWVTEDAEIGFAPPGDTGRQDAPCLPNLQLLSSYEFASMMNSLLQWKFCIRCT